MHKIICLIFILVFIQSYTVLCQDIYKDIDMLEVEFPLNGIYISPNTPGSKIPSHGTTKYGEKFALDLVKVIDTNKNRKPYKASLFNYLFFGLDLDEFYGWRQKIYSPIAGEVVEIENNVEERNPVNIFKDILYSIKAVRRSNYNSEFLKNVAGNYIIIKHSQDVYVLLAHLRKSSILVAKGQRIEEHDELGELGHSGNSTMPHLHMQFMNNKDYRIAQGLPFVFKEYEVKDKDNWNLIKKSIPKSNDLIRYFINK